MHGKYLVINVIRQEIAGFRANVFIFRGFVLHKIVIITVGDMQSTFL